MQSQFSGFDIRPSVLGPVNPGARRNPAPAEFLLAIQRMEFLHCDEKLLLGDTCRDMTDLAGLSLSDIESIIGRRLRTQRWNPAGLSEAVASDQRLFDRMGIVYVHYDDADFPPALRELSTPPFGLYLRGTLPPADRPAAAVVGTRCPTGKGLTAALALGTELAAAGIPVVSGLARGIDAAAHRAAISAGGYTCAVLPCGIDRIYPPANRGLASAILESRGGLVSEYPPGTEIHKYRFPERNRIIAGLCRACVVVEAPAKSGALITADHALGEGRDVWVHGACAGGQRNAGGDRLASEGAGILHGASALLADWGMAAARLCEGPRVCGDFAAGAGPGAGRRLAAELGAELGLETVCAHAGSFRESRPGDF